MFDVILKQIEDFDSIIIFGHLNPDGDCYGAQLGLKEIILANYPTKRVYITGTGCPRFFDLLSPMDAIDDDVFLDSLGILVDANDLPRAEDKRIFSCKAHAKIDHHIDTGGFIEGPEIVDTLANSTCDIIAGLAMDYNLKVTALAASALYLGIMTDSARFQFVNDYPTTFARAKFLCDCGANPKALSDLLNGTEEKYLAAKGYVLTHYEKTDDGVIYIIYPKSVLADLKISANTASNMINLLGNVHGYPIWCSFAEYEDGRVRSEFRSNGPLVQPVALKYGGGGHALASGCQLNTLDYERIGQIIDDLNLVAKEWRK